MGRAAIVYRPNIDLAILAPNFTEYGDYTKEVILEELEYYQKLPDFLCLISQSGNVINGFLVGYRIRNSLWIAQVWSGTSLSTGREAILLAKDWAKTRGMTSITFETKRNEMRAMFRYGFKEFSVIMRAKI
jgi:hypothetical protein